MKREIATSVCECCHLEMVGVLYKSIHNAPYLFECILCNPREFEHAHESDKDRRSRNSSDEQSTFI